MEHPRIGVSLPTFGPYASGESIVSVAQAADRLGFHSVSASERLLLPAGPDWTNEARLPDSYAWEPLEALTWAAAHTQRAAGPLRPGPVSPMGSRQFVPSSPRRLRRLVSTRT